jgi:hypothetical protein
MRIALAIVLGCLEIVLTIIRGVLNTTVGNLAILRVRLHKSYDYREWLKRDLGDCETILELGCGSNSPILQIGYGGKTWTVDIWQPYVEKHNQLKDYKVCLKADILDMAYGVKGYDAVVVFDVLEHLPKEKVLAFDLFTKMESSARKKVILFTPNGYVDNDEVDGDPYQKHLSAWEPEDYLKRGYTVHGATGLRYILGKASRPKYHPYSVFEIIAMISKPWIFNRPNIAWHSYAVKELE